jgi:hypothetical protein
VRAAFQDEGGSARAEGMAGAFAATANDGGALFWNPAGAARLTRPEIDFLWYKPYAGISELDVSAGMFAAVAPTRWGTIGVAATDYNVNGLLRENIGLLHYSRRIGTKWAAGVNAKYLSHNYTVGSDAASAGSAAFVNGTGKTAMTVDAGLLYSPTEKLSFGAGGRDLTEPNVGLVSTDKVPAVYRTGAAWRPLRALTLEADAESRDQKSGRAKDKSDFLLVALRGGYAVNQARIAVGASLEMSPRNAFGLRFDYAFLPNNEVGDAHKVGISLAFGPGEAAVAAPVRPAPVRPAPAAVPAKRGKPAAVPPGPPATKVAVTRFEVKNTGAALGASTAARVKAELKKYAQFAVVEPAAPVPVQPAAKKGKRSPPPPPPKPVPDCAAVPCAAEWGRALGAERVLVGVVNRQEKGYYVKLTAVDVTTGKILFADFVKVASAPQVADAAAALTRRAIAKFPPPSPAPGAKLNPVSGPRRKAR